MADEPNTGTTTVDGDGGTPPVTQTQEAKPNDDGSANCGKAKSGKEPDASVTEALTRLRNMEKRNDDLQKTLEDERKQAREFKRQHMDAETFAVEERRILEEREAKLKRAQVETAVTKKFALDGIALEDEFGDVFPFLAAENIEDAERLATALASFIRRREEDAVTKAHEELVRTMPQMRGGSGTTAPAEKGSFGAQVAANRLKSMGLTAKK